MAVDHQSGREVELALFDPEAVQADDWSAFARVVTAASAAKIPGLVLPRGVTRTVPSPPFHVAELQSARGFDRRVEQGPTPWPRALALCERVAEIVERAHAASGAAHRALTPSRCVVTAREDVRVLDFGLAEFAAVRADDSPYRAPEQRRGAGDPRSDVFAIGVMLFELVTGRQATSGPLPRPGSTVESSPEVDALIERATAADPSRRHADPAALRAALRVLIDAAETARARAESEAMDDASLLPPEARHPPDPAVDGGDVAATGRAAGPALQVEAVVPSPATPPDLPVVPPPERAPSVLSVPSSAPSQLPLLLSAEEKTDVLARDALVPSPPLLSSEEKTDVLARDALVPSPPLLSSEEKTDVLARDALVSSAPAPMRRTGAQPTVSSAASPRKTGAQASLSAAPIRRTGAQTAVPASPRKTGAQASLSAAPIRRTGAQPAVPASPRKTGAQASLSAAPIRRTGAQAAVPASPRKTGAQASLSAAPIRRTGAQPAVPHADRTEVAPAPTARSPLATASYRTLKGPTGAHRPVVADARAGASSEASTVTVHAPTTVTVMEPGPGVPRDFRIAGGQVVAKPGPAHAGATLLLTAAVHPEPSPLSGPLPPHPETPGPPTQSGETVVLRPVDVPRDISSSTGGAAWPLRKTLFVVNAALALVVLIGWMMVAR